MALVKDIRIINDGNPNYSKATTVMDVCYYWGIFSMKTYRQNDPHRQGPATQNIMLKRREAEILYEALGQFLASAQ